MNNVAIIAVTFVKKLPADLENIKLSWETPMPSAPPSDFCKRTKITSSNASIIFIICSLTLTILSRSELTPSISVIDKI